MLNRVTISTLLKTVIMTLGLAVIVMLSLTAWELLEPPRCGKPSGSGRQCRKLSVHRAL